MRTTALRRIRNDPSTFEQHKPRLSNRLNQKPEIKLTRAITPSDETKTIPHKFRTAWVAAKNHQMQAINRVLSNHSHSTIKLIPNLVKNNLS